MTHAHKTNMAAAIRFNQHLAALTGQYREASPAMPSATSRSRPKPQKPGKNERGTAKVGAPTQREEDLRAKAIKEVFKPKEEPEKGAGKGNKKNPGPRLPKELVGHNGAIGGVPLCYSYNLQNCKDAEPGQKCKRGLHFCARKGCEKEPHAFKDCPRRFG